ncbi:MAG: AglZ/HisF2 family acetamidino modification protein [Bacteroidota bacterium]|nr:AglZ/HisF2 family acetamidino modification protein [Bacteroidota bacterium]
MLLVRYIPCLLLKDNGLVKTVNFKNPKYVGDPINTVRIFNEKEVDELIFLDIEATPKNREPNYKLLAEIANECFMPLAYGGGIKTFEQAQKIYNIGIEKVAINSFLHKDLNLVTQISEVYGAQAVIGVIDVKKNFFGKNQIVSNSANDKHKYTIEEWVKRLEKAGVGEILITSVDNEGTWNGLDVELIKQVTSISKVPVIAHGGAGNIDHLVAGIKQGGANAIAMGSMVVYQKKDFGVLVNFPDKKILEDKL